MNKKTKIYLDTSVINFLFADDAPEKKEVTVELFEKHIKPGVYATFISPFVVAEIEETKNIQKRNSLLKVINDYPMEMIDISIAKQEIDELSSRYMYENIIPQKKYADALHIATSVLFEMNYLVSWNYKHLANIKKERQVHIVNMQMNYTADLKIITPLELITHGE